MKQSIQSLVAAPVAAQPLGASSAAASRQAAWGTAPAAGPRLDALAISHGKRVRLWRLLYGYGPANGTLLVLPLDQGIEHGPADFFPNPAALDTDFQFRLALEGRYSAIAVGIGLAEKYMRAYCGRVPLILKINGKTNIPDDGDAVSPLTASVDAAVRLGADAVGYTLYVGSPRQDEELRQFARVREACERSGMPIVMWAYPRGRAIEEKGGKGTLFAIDYAARTAEELGADIVKLHEPGEDNDRCPEPYRSLRETPDARIRRVVRSSGKCLVLFSGGAKRDADGALAKVETYMTAGASGIIFGRNLWQRPFDEALALTRDAHAILARYSA
jgi:class I fructose-bisphosphate aldolase